MLGAAWEGFSYHQGVETDGGERLQGCRVESAVELVLMLDWAWNRILADLRKNVQTWVFVDGAIERKRYMDILNILGSLLPYITNQTPGKGVILTPARNVAFDDSYAGDEENAITKLFTE